MFSITINSPIAQYIDLLICIVALAFVVVFAYEACLQKNNTLAICAVAAGLVSLSTTFAAGFNVLAKARK